MRPCNNQNSCRKDAGNRTLLKLWSKLIHQLFQGFFKQAAMEIWVVETCKWTIVYTGLKRGP